MSEEQYEDVMKQLRFLRDSALQRSINETSSEHSKVWSDGEAYAYEVAMRLIFEGKS